MTDNGSTSLEPNRDGNAEHGRKPKTDTKARLFDIRAIIGGLFLLYGVLIGTAGVFAGRQAIQKAQGVNINLWTGGAMLLVGAMFLLWLKLRPLSPRPSGGDESEPM